MLRLRFFFSLFARYQTIATKTVEYFHNGKPSDIVGVYLYNKISKQVKHLEKVGDGYDLRESFNEHCSLLVRAEDKLVEISSMRYFGNDINYIHIHYQESADNDYVRIYGNKYFNNKSDNFYIEFGREDFFYVPQSAKKTKKLARLLKTYLTLGFKN